VREPDDHEGPTVTMRRDALRGLLQQSGAPPAPLAHTVSRELLRERVPHRDLDLDPAPPPLLVFGVIAVLVTLFVAVTQLH
jgi:hypothetical protein